MPGDSCFSAIYLHSDGVNYGSRMGEGDTPLFYGVANIGLLVFLFLHLGAKKRNMMLYP